MMTVMFGNRREAIVILYTITKREDGWFCLDINGNVGWFKTEERAKAMADAFSKGILDAIIWDKHSLSMISISEWEFEVQWRFLSAKKGSMIIPIKRVRVHKHGTETEVVNLVTGKSYWLKNGKLYG